MRVAVLLNARSGALLDRSIEEASEAVASQLEAAGLEPVVIGPEGGLTERMERAMRANVAAIVVGGGDGTIGCAAQMLAGTDVALGLIPLGTMNVFARDIGMPIGLDEATASLAGGVAIRSVDVGEVNGHVFLCSSALGMFPRLAMRREKSRGAMGLSGWWRMAVATVKSLTRYPMMRAAIRLEDGRLLKVRVRSITVTDNPWDDDPGRVMARSRLDGGELGVYVAKGLTPWRALRVLLRMALTGGWRRESELLSFRQKRLTVTSARKRMRVMNDGEVVMLSPPLRYRIRPRALRVLVPAASEAVSKVAAQ